MNKNRLSSFTNIRNAFFSKAAIGILANIILLLFHAHNFLLEHRPKSTDLTIGHLALIHIVMLLTMAFMAIDTFGSRKTWDDIECKLVVYVYSLMRGLSICTTCLLSVLQAITLSPRNSCLAKFKLQSSHHSLYCILFLWVFNMFISGYFLVSTVATPNVTSTHLLRVTESCSLRPVIHFLRYIPFVLRTFQDACLLGLVALSSGYVVTLLCRHTRQTQHLHSTKLSPKASPEEKATQTILLLMSFFVLMYFLDITVSWFSRMLWNIDSVRMCVQMLVGNGYASISPLVLISTGEPKKSHVCLQGLTDNSGSAGPEELPEDTWQCGKQTDFLLCSPWRLLWPWSTGSRHTGVSRRSAGLSGLQGLGSGEQAQPLRHTGLAAPRYMGSSQTRDGCASSS